MTDDQDDHQVASRTSQSAWKRFLHHVALKDPEIEFLAEIVKNFGIFCAIGLAAIVLNELIYLSRFVTDQSVIDDLNTLKQTVLVSDRYWFQFSVVISTLVLMGRRLGLSPDVLASLRPSGLIKRFLGSGNLPDSPNAQPPSQPPHPQPLNHPALAPKNDGIAALPEPDLPLFDLVQTPDPVKVTPPDQRPITSP